MEEESFNDNFIYFRFALSTGYNDRTLHRPRLPMTGQ